MQPEIESQFRTIFPKPTFHCLLDFTLLESWHKIHYTQYVCFSNSASRTWRAALPLFNMFSTSLLFIHPSSSCLSRSGYTSRINRAASNLSRFPAAVPLVLPDNPRPTGKRILAPQEFPLQPAPRCTVQKIFETRHCTFSNKPSGSSNHGSAAAWLSSHAAVSSHCQTHTHWFKPLLHLRTQLLRTRIPNFRISTWLIRYNRILDVSPQMADWVGWRKPDRQQAFRLVHCCLCFKISLCFPSHTPTQIKSSLLIQKPWFSMSEKVRNYTMEHWLS